MDSFRIWPQDAWDDPVHSLLRGDDAGVTPRCYPLSSVDWTWVVPTRGLEVVTCKRCRQDWWKSSLRVFKGHRKRLA